MYSEALSIIDRNTANYMIEELQKELKNTPSISFVKLMGNFLHPLPNHSFHVMKSNLF